MSESQASFELRGRNPDVLSCIANLSNDEVFTPPEFANRMLDTLTEAWGESNDGANLWSNPDVRFLDPFAKSGIFLREITKRLTEGLENKIPDLHERVDHILTKQVFGIGTTSLTSLLARRSVYCSKFANGEHSIAKSLTTEQGNIWFERIDHMWVGGTQWVYTADAAGNPVQKFTNGKCEFCGANQRDYDRGEGSETHAYTFIHTKDIKARMAELFGDDMNFDVIIGNPPYQLGHSGGDAIGSFAMPVYQRFVRAAKSLDPRYVVMVTPSRWFAGGRGLDTYRAEMLGDKRVRELVDFPDAADVFPGVDIGGGISYFLWDKEHKGECRVRTIAEGVSDEPAVRRLDAYNVLVRYNAGVAILEKVWPDGVVGPTLAGKVSSIQPFGLRTAVRGAASAKGLKKPVTLKSRDGISYIELASIPKNKEWVDKWKVILGRAYGERGSFPYWITSRPEVLPPDTATTETYLVINRFDDEHSAALFCSYLRTRFVRFLISLRKNTQDIYNERFAFVPDLEMDQEWTDAKLYEKYKLSDEEIGFIETVVRPMGSSEEKGS